MVQSQVSTTASVTTLLCQVPWPARRICATSTPQNPLFPWDPSAQCDIPGVPVWSPFYDPVTNASFYYCRNATSTNEATSLPSLNESVVRVTPARDILAEYLLTFTSGGSGAPNRDAIGFRISKNLDHVGVAQWYKSKGFTGSPSVIAMDGYDALQDGRTVYANSGTLYQIICIPTSIRCPTMTVPNRTVAFSIRLLA